MKSYKSPNKSISKPNEESSYSNLSVMKPIFIPYKSDIMANTSLKIQYPNIWKSLDQEIQHKKFNEQIYSSSKCNISDLQMINFDIFDENSTKFKRLQKKISRGFRFGKANITSDLDIDYTNRIKPGELVLKLLKNCLISNKFAMNFPIQERLFVLNISSSVLSKKLIIALKNISHELKSLSLKHITEFDEQETQNCSTFLSKSIKQCKKLISLDLQLQGNIRNIFIFTDAFNDLDQLKYISLNIPDFSGGFLLKFGENLKRMSKQIETLDFRVTNLQRNLIEMNEFLERLAFCKILRELRLEIRVRERQDEFLYNQLTSIMQNMKLLKSIDVNIFQHIFFEIIDLSIKNTVINDAIELFPICNSIIIENNSKPFNLLIDLIENRKYSELDYRKLLKFVENNQVFAKISLTSKNNRFDNFDFFMSNFADQVSQIKTLENLMIFMEENQDLTDEILKSFAEKLQNSVSITQLTLAFYLSNNIKDLGFSHLANMFCNFNKNLKELRLSLGLDFNSNVKISENSIINLINSTKSFPNLRKLELNFERHENFNDEVIQRTFLEGDTWESLESINLNVNFTSISDNGIVFLLEGFERMQLKEITLHLELCKKVTQVCLFEFRSFILASKGLMSIRIKFYGMIMKEDLHLILTELRTSTSIQVNTTPSMEIYPGKIYKDLFDINQLQN